MRLSLGWKDLLRDVMDSTSCAPQLQVKMFFHGRNAERRVQG